MKFRPHIEWLEARENPSGPELLDPIEPITSPDPVPPSQPAPPEPAPTEPIIDPNLFPYNPWGG